MTSHVPDSGYTVAVLGATGLVGSRLLAILEERQFPIKRLKPLASQRSAGESIRFRGEPVEVLLAEPEAFEGVDIVLASAGASISARLAPEAVKRGAVVVDNTSQFRMEEGVPLVVAGVNDDDLRAHKGIIANPNCSTSQLMPVLKALHDAAGLTRVIVSTYQSVSGAGKEAIDELRAVTAEQLAAPDGAAVSRHEVFARCMAFNLIPHIDVFLTEGPLSGYTKEEAKVVWETRKILHLPSLPVTCTAVRAPVMVGHSESVTLEFERPLSPEAARDILKSTPDVIVADGPADYHTPQETAGTDPVYVSRIRPDSSNPERGLNLWVVADNLRIGAALNAVRIAEQLIARKLLGAAASV
ncbi:MAG: aspartate-semialdehyde dehydrogenase [Vampirovibrionales bacterium]|nr:aspartate-semialdehyde dehydrogenase [Vampirovibrionales bacterium]